MAPPIPSNESIVRLGCKLCDPVSLSRFIFETHPDAPLSTLAEWEENLEHDIPFQDYLDILNNYHIDEKHALVADLLARDTPHTPTPRWQKFLEGAYKYELEELHTTLDLWHHRISIVRFTTQMCIYRGQPVVAPRSPRPPPTPRQRQLPTPHHSSPVVTLQSADPARHLESDPDDAGLNIRGPISPGLAEFRRQARRHFEESEIGRLIASRTFVDLDSGEVGSRQKPIDIETAASGSDTSDSSSDESESALSHKVAPHDTDAHVYHNADGSVEHFSRRRPVRRAAVAKTYNEEEDSDLETSSSSGGAETTNKEPQRNETDENDSDGDESDETQSTNYDLEQSKEDYIADKASLQSVQRHRPNTVGKPLPGHDPTVDSESSSGEDYDTIKRMFNLDTPENRSKGKGKAPATISDEDLVSPSVARRQSSRAEKWNVASSSAAQKCNLKVSDPSYAVPASIPLVSTKGSSSDQTQTTTATKQPPARSPPRRILQRIESTSELDRAHVKNDAQPEDKSSGQRCLRDPQKRPPKSTVLSGKLVMPQNRTLTPGPSNPTPSETLQSEPKSEELDMFTVYNDQKPASSDRPSIGLGMEQALHNQAGTRPVPYTDPRPLDPGVVHWDALNCSETDGEQSMSNNEDARRRYLRKRSSPRVVIPKPSQEIISRFRSSLPPPLDMDETAANKSVDGTTDEDEHRDGDETEDKEVDIASDKDHDEDDDIQDDVDEDNDEVVNVGKPVSHDEDADQGSGDDDDGRNDGMDLDTLNSATSSPLDELSRSPEPTDWQPEQPTLEASATRRYQNDDADDLDDDHDVTAHKKRKSTSAKSDHFQTSPSKRRKAGQSVIVPPPITHKSFGIVQERLWQDPYRLLLATMFLNKTAGKSAMPIFNQLLEAYPTPQALAEAEWDNVFEIIKSLGLQKIRTKKLITFAQMWIESPPCKGRRYRAYNYPMKKNGSDIKPGQILDFDDQDCTGALEIAHLFGCGEYAYDSWRIFCRDVLRGVAIGYNGEGAEPDFEPEWQRVVPKDKELRACLRWMWLREGWDWDPVTGHKQRADDALMLKALRGELAIVETELDGTAVSDLDNGEFSARSGGVVHVSSVHTVNNDTTFEPAKAPMTIAVLAGQSSMDLDTPTPRSVFIDPPPGGALHATTPAQSQPSSDQHNRPIPQPWQTKTWAELEPHLPTDPTASLEDSPLARCAPDATVADRSQETMLSCPREQSISQRFATPAMNTFFTDAPPADSMFLHLPSPTASHPRGDSSSLLDLGPRESEALFQEYVTVNSPFTQEYAERPHALSATNGGVVSRGFPDFFTTAGELPLPPSQAPMPFDHSWDLFTPSTTLAPDPVSSQSQALADAIATRIRGILESSIERLATRLDRRDPQPSAYDTGGLFSACLERRLQLRHSPRVDNHMQALCATAFARAGPSDERHEAPRGWHQGADQRFVSTLGPSRSSFPVGFLEGNNEDGLTSGLHDGGMGVGMGVDMDVGLGVGMGTGTGTGTESNGSGSSPKMEE
ncbi:hypothetical protein CAC42_3195 [Sphaceloma murrayae]|uniref:HhH-GPD domain-containing protein n=1 Tax=Sphaceloma murrayae TaxID=2082308 RepID=A0A2K1QS85_9PEZI|nr:hypothetical protein CAC42_3195 [Sphaceloma murrayae]